MQDSRASTSSTHMLIIRINCLPVRTSQNHNSGSLSYVTRHRPTITRHLKVAGHARTSPTRTFRPEPRLFRVLADPNNDSSTLLPRDTTLYFLDPVERADPAPEPSLLASDAISAMTESSCLPFFGVQARAVVVPRPRCSHCTRCHTPQLFKKSDGFIFLDTKCRNRSNLYSNGR